MTTAPLEPGVGVRPLSDLRTFRSRATGRLSANYADGDRAEFVAGLVLQAIEEGWPQHFANDRLRRMAGVAA